jgi:hypothetical protein
VTDWCCAISFANLNLAHALSELSPLLIERVEINHFISEYVDPYIKLIF